METRTFGRTAVNLSILGFGCGAVGGVMVRGAPADQERAIARALEAGVNYFDTAVQYGNGESEKNLGRVLKKLGPKNAVVGTKVRLPASDFGRIEQAVTKSLEGSLRRLGMERVDIFHLHNPITADGGGEALGVSQVLHEVLPAFARLRQKGMIRFLGITGVGDTPALHQVIDSRAVDSAQIVYNMLNPSAAVSLPARYPAQDYGRLFDRTHAAGGGTRRARHRRARGRGAAGHGRAPSDRKSAAGADRFRRKLRGRPRARAATRPAGRGGLCRKSCRGGDALCDLAPRRRHHPGRHGDARAIRDPARRRAERPAAARRARSARHPAP